ncbi:MAG: D-2-hydroxyacid dehydrogenase [Planctomycetota bacterium]
MPSKNPSVLVAFDLAQEIVECLQDEFVDLSFHVAAKPQELVPQLEAVRPEVVFSIKGERFPATAHKAIMSFPSVRWVQVGGSGYEHLTPWDGNRLVVTNCSGVLSRFLAENVIGAMLALNANFLTYVQQQKKREWSPHEFRPLADQTLLIVGLGHIGRCVAERAKALGMRVIGVRRTQESHSSVDVVVGPKALSDVIAEADVVSLHLRMSYETQQLFDAAMFARMRRGALFLNTARGGVVVEEALIKALESGHLRGAYLDVFDKEPLPGSSPLWEMQNVLLTPHCGDNISGWYRKFTEFFAENLRRWVAGKPLQNVVTTLS